MNAPDALLGIDIGTSGCKAILIDVDAKVLASAMVDYPLAVPKPGWAEQNPADWWEATCGSVRQVLAQVPGVQVKAIGLSGQMHGMVPLDQERSVIRPAILWNDQRNQSQCERIQEQAGGLTGLLALTNNKMLPGYTGGKITWLRDEEPANYERLDLVLNPKDYIRLQMTGEEATDVSDASGTGLFDVRTRTWSNDLIAKVGIAASLLPRVHESDEITGYVHAQAAELLGLPVGIPVVAGGGDAVIQSTGSGVVAPGLLQVIIGTAGIFACALREPVANNEGRLQVFCNNAPELWHCMGVSINAGGALAWLRRVLAQTQGVDPAALTYADLIARAGQAQPGAGGLLFLPYLQGERCPHNDPDARGAFVGLNLNHGEAEMIRAVIEGVVFSLANMYQLFADLGVESGLIISSGGGSASKLWCQIQADVFNCEVVTVSGASEGGAFGAALVAGVGTKWWSNLKDASAKITRETSVMPNKDNTSIYQDTLANYLGLYEALRPTFQGLATLNK